MESKPTVKVLKTGTICFEPTEIASAFTHQIKAGMGIGGGSTVVLVETDRKIIVDTGFDCEWLDTITNNERNAGSLKRALQYHGVAPDEIDTVFITHWHRDHFGNLGIFSKAAHIALNSLIERFGLDNFKGANDGEEIAEGVKVMLTSGHTVDHASVIVDSMIGDVNARVAIAGDAAISHSYLHSGHIWRYNTDFYDQEVARESILRLLDVSDIIIPGHGTPFMTYKPEWAKNTLRK
ncbi:MBL fold metallo-hydrolase [Chloroflexota bacterium]